MANTRRATPFSRFLRAQGNTVHRIKVTLCDTRPPVWRRLEVPSDVTLQELHHMVQAVFGWQDAHMWAFRAPSGARRPPGRGPAVRSPAASRLDRIAPGPGDRLRYTYGFRPGWEHGLLVEAVVHAEPGTVYPRCPAGRRACPPEDCGGIREYAYLLDVLADPSHEEHTQRLDRLGIESAGQFDPAAFDPAAANGALARFATVLAEP
ncbi:plasmid pRiA4b ORF-3 family protein [Streptomyces sp. NPDC093109]|uniref:plasmid pRiA4b ORF-3 family protein n=1 Tax=Streptomyces sp. NPDC093109 TaxID=3154977 RepID=UPI00344C8454